MSGLGLHVHHVMMSKGVSAQNLLPAKLSLPCARAVFAPSRSRALCVLAFCHVRYFMLRTVRLHCNGRLLVQLRCGALCHDAADMVLLPVAL